MTEPNTDEMQKRVDELGEDIEATRRQAEDDGLLPDSDPDPTFIDPDADGRRDDADEEPGTTMGF